MNYIRSFVSKYKVILFGIGSFLLIIGVLNARSIYDEMQNTQSLNGYSIEEVVINSNIEIVFSDTLPTLFYEPGTSLTFEGICKELEFKYAINGGYFKSDKSHAGLLITDGEIITDFAGNDKQLTHVVMWRAGSDSLKFIDNTEWELIDLSLDDVTAFQTGPLIISENIVQTEFIESSINGEGAYKRSLLGFTKSGKFFFVATREGVTLKDVAKYLLDEDNLKNEVISVINLDGGPSTWLYGSEEGVIVDGISDVLPVILGFGE